MGHVAQCTQVSKRLYPLIPLLEAVGKNQNVYKTQDAQIPCIIQGRLFCQLAGTNTPALSITKGRDSPDKRREWPAASSRGSTPTPSALGADLH